MAKSKSKHTPQDAQARDMVTLAGVWPDPPVSELPASRSSMKNKVYLRELSDLQLELAKLQEWIRANGFKIFLNQCTIHSFCFLLQSLRDPQTVRYAS